jgi:chemotaxis protein CheZ
MTDERFPLSPTAPPPTEADYEAIAAAVMETVRGRWFLGEFAKRNRNADTDLILQRIDRIETLLREPEPVSPAERVRIDLVEMAKAIARTRREIAAIKPDGDAKGTLSEASEELDSIVLTTERATSDILAATERIQEIAWTLRERGTDGAICDALDQRATDIYSACSFQDLTGQRTRKVVEVLQFLEDRIRAMIEIWGGAMPEQDEAPAPMAAPHVGEDRTVPHLEQQEIDLMMPAAQAAAPPAQDFGIASDIAASASPGPGDRSAMREAAVATARPADAAVAVETVMMPMAAVVGATALALDLTPVEVARQPQPAPAPEPVAEPEPAPDAELASDPEPASAHHPEPAPEIDAQHEAMPRSAAAQPEPVAAPEPEPAPETVATPSEPRADPAAVLKRILAIIRAPNQPAARAIGADAAPPTPAAAQLAEPAEQAFTRAPDVVPSGPTPADPGTTEAAVLAAEISGSDAVAAMVAAPESAPSNSGSARPHEPAQERAPQAVLDEAAEDILMPLPGPLTVDQAVDAMRKTPGRVEVAAAPIPAGAAAPEPEAPPADQPSAVTAEPVTSEMPPATATRAQQVVIEVPEFTAARAPAPASQMELAAEPRPEQGQREPASSPAAAATVGAPLAAPRPPAVAASEAPPPPADAVAAPPPPPIEVAAAAPAPRYPALAAIAALSDDDKIALFS